MSEEMAAKLKSFPWRLSIVAAVFVISGLIFPLLLKNSIATVSLTTEGLLNCLPTLACFFVLTSLAIIFSIVADRKIALICLLAVSLLFILSLPPLSFSLMWRAAMIAIYFLGLLFLNSQAGKVHEMYLGFSASHYHGILRTFFFFFIIILALLLFLAAQQTLEQRRTLFSSETLEPIVGMVVEKFGGLLAQEFGGNVPGEELAPPVEEMMLQLLERIGVKVQLEGQPASLAEVTTRISEMLENQLLDVSNAAKLYIPFILSLLLLLTLGGFYPLVVPVGILIFFIIYRLLLLMKILKFEEVERTAKRLILA